jgi:CRISPR-associated protein Cmr4
MEANVPLPYEQRLYLAESLDPIHIGTGEFRLGRVDNTIVREPGTNLPKIPGSSLSGVARAYTAMLTGKYRWMDGTEEKMCAGKGGPNGEKHCGKADCPVCTTYGFSIGQRSFQGLAQIGDARILFFPVHSPCGPLWISCPEVLADAGVPDMPDPGDSAIAVGPGQLDAIEGAPVVIGWRSLPRLQRTLAVDTWQCGGKLLSAVSQLVPALARLVILSERHFSDIVNDHLEVRTSVSISPSTGAAEHGALFTSEAIPRATFFFFPVTCLKPEFFLVPLPNGQSSPVRNEGEDATVNHIHKRVEDGLKLMEMLGVGGINTRGMGRLRLLQGAEHES